MEDFFDLCKKLKIGTVLHKTSRNTEFTLTCFGTNRKNEDVLKYKISETQSKNITRTELNILWDTLDKNRIIIFDEIKNQNITLFRSGDCYRFIFKELCRLAYPQKKFVEGNIGRLSTFSIT
ncbi:MAG: hypothetical protein A2X18_07095 [Bacteroidetes bacterium GWF2_40_14]|nr:MAG: hypothetical protein A2X18_07095 [Bacteroidetes bacterium GWF2_40_14]